MDTLERRQWERIPVMLEARCCDRQKAFVPYLKAELTDIHHCGCRMLGTCEFSRGDIVSVMVNLPMGEQLIIEGMVAWASPVATSRSFETGVRFLTYDFSREATYRKLFEFCLYNKPDYQETFCL